MLKFVQVQIVPPTSGCPLNRGGCIKTGYNSPWLQEEVILGTCPLMKIGGCIRTSRAIVRSAMTFQYRYLQEYFNVVESFCFFSTCESVQFLIVYYWFIYWLSSYQ